uniref:Rho guanine nucleotide exchange factor 7 n=1 Tax=Schistosoma haematobium TaxID=6185 RepID=A0A094ZVG3_SCHHA
MKYTHGPKCMGRLFLDFAPAINAVGCDYSKIYLHVITGLEEHITEVTKYMSSFNIKLQLVHCKQQLILIFERLGRYPLLLKEMERYLEEPHVDRPDILRAMNVYSEITERCAILRKFKEYDINVLLSVIKGWRGPPIQQLGDPILTLRVLLVNIQVNQSMITLPDFIHINDILTRKTQLSLLVIFPTCVLLLARTNQTNVYDYTVKIPLNNLAVIRSTESETDLDLLIKDLNSMNMDVIPCQITLACTDQNARDLLVSTLTDLIQYQTQNEQQSPDIDQCHTKNESISLDFFSQPDSNSLDRHGNTSLSSLPLRKDTLDNEKLKSSKITRDENNQIDQHQSTLVMSTLSMKDPQSFKFPPDSTDNLAAQHTYTKDISKISFVNNDNAVKITDIYNFISNSTNNNDDNKRRFSSSLKKSKALRPLTEPSNICAEELNNESQHRQSSVIDPQSKQIFAPVDNTCTVVLTSDVLTSSSGLRFLPHRITTNAHVLWFDIDKSIVGTRQSYSTSIDLPGIIPYKNNEQLSSDNDLIHAIHCLRVDGPLDFNRDDRIGSVNALNNLGLLIDQNIPGLLLDFSISHKNQHNRVRAQSPKVTDSNRQKSAITAEDVLRSTGKIHENELRTADDTKILQVIEAYCASSWTHPSYRTLDSVKNECQIGGQGILSPVESRTLLQHFRYPKKPSTSFLSTSSSGMHSRQEQDSHITDASIFELSRQSLPLSMFSSKASLKRSESKNKSQTCLSQDGTVCLNQNIAANVISSNSKIISSVTTTSSCTNCTPCNSNQSSSYTHNIQCESILKTFSPPPVILPTHSGRR